MRTIHLVRFGIVLACCAVGCVSLQEMEQARRQQEASVWTSQCAVRLEEYWNNIAEGNASLLLSVLNDGKHRNEKEINEIETHIRNWLVPRIKSLSDDDALKGDSLLEEFGTKYMPNAYANYEKVRDTAKLCQNAINENFKTLYGRQDENLCSAIKAFSKARVQYFRRHDELCHYYLLHKAGGLSAAQLSEIDKKPISIFLLEPLNRSVTVPLLPPVNEKTISFINKQMPDAAPYIGKLQEKRNELQEMRNQLMADARLLDYDRYDLAIMACTEGECTASGYLYGFFKCANSLQLKHTMMNITAEELQEKDKQSAEGARLLCAALEKYVERRACGRLFGRDVMMEKFYSFRLVRGWQFDAIGLYRNPSGSGAFSSFIYGANMPHIYVGHPSYEGFVMRRNSIHEFREEEDRPRYAGYFPEDLVSAAFKNNRLDWRDVKCARNFIEEKKYRDRVVICDFPPNRITEVSGGKCYVANCCDLLECLCAIGVGTKDGYGQWQGWTENGHPQRSIFEIRASEVDGVYYTATIEPKELGSGMKGFEIELQEL